MTLDAVDQPSRLDEGWSRGDLTRRLTYALEFAAVAVKAFGETGYTDSEQPALSFGPEKVIAEATMLAYAAFHATTNRTTERRVQELARLLAQHARSPRVLAEMAMKPEQVFNRATPHVLLTSMGFSDDAFDQFAIDRCRYVLEHSADQPPVVHAERSWLMSVWQQPFTPVLTPTAGTPLALPFDFLRRTREDPYGLTHQLFYATDFGRNNPVGLARPKTAIFEDIEGLVLRYLDHEDYDITAELLMAWPQLHEPWSPTASFAFRVLAEVEDEAGILPCGNVDPIRLAALEGEAQTRYARAVSYHTAFVMGLLCAVSLRAGVRPARRIRANAYTPAVTNAMRARVHEDRGDWQPIFDRLTDTEKLALAPMLACMSVTQSLRRQDLREAHAVAGSALESGFPHSPVYDAADNLAQSIASAMALSEATPATLSQHS